MSAAQRQHTRFSVDLVAKLIRSPGNSRPIKIQQISLGGCFTTGMEDIYAGDEFRLEIPLPNGNRLPLTCKAVYRFEGSGIGARFLGITQFEQELIAKIIAHRLEADGVPVPFDSLGRPATYESSFSSAMTDPKPEREEILDSILTSD